MNKRSGNIKFPTAWWARKVFFFDRKEVKDLISYLATIENPQADEYLLRILNTPPRGISELTSHLAIDWSREHGNSVWAALQDEEIPGGPFHPRPQQRAGIQ